MRGFGAPSLNFVSNGGRAEGEERRRGRGRGRSPLVGAEKGEGKSGTIKSMNILSVYMLLFLSSVFCLSARRKKEVLFWRRNMEGADVIMDIFLLHVSCVRRVFFCWFKRLPTSLLADFLFRFDIEFY